MRRSILVVPLLVIPLLVFPLPSAPHAAADGSTAPAPSEAPSVALPPELDRVLRDYERHWRAGDAAALAELFTEDGWVFANGRAPVRGRAAIRATYEGMDGGPLRLRALAWAVDGDVGYVLGGFGYGDAPGDGGKFTLTLRRTPGGPWLIASDMDNGNHPPRCPDSTSTNPGSASS
jgi:ketosteroid isomerase-like protein